MNKLANLYNACYLAAYSKFAELNKEALAFEHIAAEVKRAATDPSIRRSVFKKIEQGRQTHPQFATMWDSMHQKLMSMSEYAQPAVKRSREVVY